MTDHPDPYAEGYRQAVLDCARCLCLADHVGDVHSSIALVWCAAGLAGDGPPRDENTGEPDADRLEGMGARPCYEVQPLEHARESRLIDTLAAALTSWPHVWAPALDDLADVLGLKIQRSRDGEYARIDPDTLPSWYEDSYAPAPEGETEWEL